MRLHAPTRSDIDAVQAVGLQQFGDIEAAWHAILSAREMNAPANARRRIVLPQ
jgi:hypothetical protein